MVECIVFAGGGGHAAVVQDAAKLSWKETTLKVVWDISTRVHQSLQEWVHVQHEEDLQQLLTHKQFSEILCYVCFGDPALRMQKVQCLRKVCKSISVNCLFPNVVHSAAFLSDASVIHEGNYFGPHAVLEAGARVGCFCIINAAAVVAHDCQVHDFVNVNPHACICGSVTIKSGVIVGAGAVVREKTYIETGVQIGMGSVVTKDIMQSDCTCFGVPARYRYSVSEKATGES